MPWCWCSTALRGDHAGAAVEATPGTILGLPAGVPHGVDATAPARMLLVMLKDA